MVAKNPRYARNVAGSEQRLVIRKSAPSFAAQRQLNAKVPAASKNFKTNNARPPNHKVEKYATTPAPHSWSIQGRTVGVYANGSARSKWPARTLSRISAI